MEAPFQSYKKDQYSFYDLCNVYDESVSYITKDFDKKIFKLLKSNLTDIQKIESLSNIQKKIMNSVVVLNKPNTDFLKSKLLFIDKDLLSKQHSVDKLIGKYNRTKQNNEDLAIQIKEINKEIKLLTKKKVLIENHISGKAYPGETANLVLSKVRYIIQRLQEKKETNSFPSQQPQSSQIPFMSQQPQPIQMPFIVRQRQVQQTSFYPQSQQQVSANAVCHDPIIIQQQELSEINDWFDSIRFQISFKLLGEINSNPQNVLTWLNSIHETQLKKLKDFINSKSITTFSEQDLVTMLKNLQKDQIDYTVRSLKNLNNTLPAEPLNFKLPDNPYLAKTLRSLYNEYIIAKDKNDYVSLFGLNKGYTEKEVMKAFTKKFALKLHPDKNIDYPNEAEVLFKLFEGLRTYLINDIKPSIEMLMASKKAT